MRRGRKEQLEKGEEQFAQPRNELHFRSNPVANSLFFSICLFISFFFSAMIS
jgi:hypothetical protein